MPRKKRKQKPPTLRSRIVSLISIVAHMKLKDMAKLLDAPYQSLNTEALELKRLGVLEKDDEGFWSLVPEVNPEEFGIEVMSSYRGDSIGSEVGSSAASTLPISESSPTLKDEFMALLRSAGVKQGIETIADLFFAGDIWDMQWLHRVLTDYARGFVTEPQCKLIMGYWAKTKGIPYRHEDFFED